MATTTKAHYVDPTQFGYNGPYPPGYKRGLMPWHPHNRECIRKAALAAVQKQGEQT